LLCGSQITIWRQQVLIGYVFAIREFIRNIHVETFGEGSDLVLLHGWAMHSGIWSGVRNRLAQYFRLHLVDLPGHGLSPTPWIDAPGTLEHMAEIVKEGLPESSIICGWSLGGQVAIELALHEPERIKKLVLVSTTPSFVQREDWIWGMEAATLKQFMKNLKRDYVSTLNRFLTLQVSGDINTSVLLTQLRESVFQEGKLDEAGLQMGLQILFTTDLREKIKSVDQPVILLHGENDAIAHPKAARWMHEHLQNSELVMLPHCGHTPLLSHTNQFITNIIRAAYI